MLPEAIASSALRGGLSALAPSEGFFREILEALSRADNRGLGAAFGRPLGLVHAAATAGEIEHVAKAAVANLSPADRASLLANTMLVLEESDGARRTSLASTLASKVVEALARTRPLSDWLETGTIPAELSRGAPLGRKSPVADAATDPSSWPTGVATTTAVTSNPVSTAPDRPDLLAPRATIRAPLSHLAPQASVAPANAIRSNRSSLVRPPQARIAIQLEPEGGPPRTVELDATRTIRVGRDPSSDLALPDPKLSRSHFRFEFPSDGTVVLVPENARNGILVDAELVNDRTVLHEGARITAGGHVFVVRIAAPADPNVTLAHPLRPIGPPPAIVTARGAVVTAPGAALGVASAMPAPTPLGAPAPLVAAAPARGVVTGTAPAEPVPFRPGPSVPSTSPVPPAPSAPAPPAPSAPARAATVARASVRALPKLPKLPTVRLNPRAKKAVLAGGGLFLLALVIGLGPQRNRSRVVRAVDALLFKGLNVVTVPEGARVVVDGEEVGTSPIRLEEIAPGKHKVSVQLDGYEESLHDVDYVAGRFLALDVALVPWQGSLVAEATGDGPAMVTLTSDRDDPPRVAETQGGTLKYPKLRVGKYHLKATRKGFDPAQVDIEVTRNAEARAKLVLAEHTGALLIRSAPPGLPALLDGASVGKTPIEKTGVPAGLHDVIVTAASGSQAAMKVKVRGDEQAVCVLDLETLEKTLASIAWARGEVPRDKLEVALKDLRDFVQTWGSGGDAASWVAGRLKELSEEKAWLDFSEIFSRTQDVDEKIALCDRFVKENPHHPRLPEVKKLGEAPDEKRGWFKESLPPKLRRGPERPLYVWNTGKGVEIEMVYVPPGEFTMGSEWSEREKPKHPHPVPYGFWIGRVEITWGQYLAFCKATARQEPEAPASGANETAPVVNVTWEDANAFCAWAGLSLPTEVEWEKAARGTDGRKFPWGSTPPNERNCVCALDAATGTPEPVGSRPEAASPFGALDMAGNVMEWCSNWYDDGTYALWAKGQLDFPKTGSAKVVRGGSFLSSGEKCRATARDWFSPKASFPEVGFRVAVTAQDGQ